MKAIDQLITRQAPQWAWDIIDEFTGTLLDLLKRGDDDRDDLIKALAAVKEIQS